MGEDLMMYRGLPPVTGQRWNWDAGLDSDDPVIIHALPLWPSSTGS
jgi:hypothetical protein